MPVTASLSRAQIVSLIGFDPLFTSGAFPVGAIINGLPVASIGQNITHSAGSNYAGSAITIVGGSGSGGQHFDGGKTVGVGTWKVIGNAGNLQRDATNAILAAAVTSYQRIA